MIRVQNLTKRFGDVVAVDDISFDVHRGEIFAFLGPNGAGKTTTIKMLTTLLKPTQGSLELDGLDPTVQRDEVRKRFGVVFQDPSLDQDLTAWENMEIHGVLYGVPRKERNERTTTLLQLFELWERRDALVKTFSGGMRRRLEIARGLLHTPKVLFLDEPTLGLDPQSRNQMWKHVKALNETDQVTVFLTTHYMDEADRVAHRIAVIDHGHVVAIGSSSELKEQTKTNSLEDAFLALTGTSIRDESASAADSMRQIARMWMREVKKYLRSRTQIIASLGSPIMYLGVLGFGLGPVFRRAGEGSYLQFMAPGVIGMTVLFTSMFSGIALLWDRQFGFLKETLVAPVPRLFIMMGRTIGGATVAIIQGCLIFVVCLIAGFRPLSALSIPLAMLFMALIAIVFAALGTVVGSSLKDMQGFQLVMNFMVMPIFFLSGALYPLSNLPKVLAVLTRLDPLTYGVDGVRTVLIGASHFGSVADLAVLVVVAFVLLGVGAWRFSKIEI